MTDDFEFYQGDDVVPYYVITEGGVEDGAPVDLSTIAGATWVATPANTTTPTLTKHLENMTLGVDPEIVGAVIENCIFVHIYPIDMGATADIGTFRHELRITTWDALQAVVYPPVGKTATFSILPSLTWNPGVSPPAPRLEEPEEELEEPVSKLKRIPKLPKEKR
jgi:hypothetical protein